MPDGREIDGFVWIRTREFAAVVAVTEREEIVLVRSYKHGPRAIALAVPAGYIEASEDPLATAKRELLEETGYEATGWTSVGRYVVDGNYGVSTEHIFLARDARRVTEPASGDLEEIEVHLVHLDDVVELLGRGDVVQLSSAAALAIALLELTPPARRQRVE